MRGEPSLLASPPRSPPRRRCCRRRSPPLAPRLPLALPFLPSPGRRPPPPSVLLLPRFPPRPPLPCRLPAGRSFPFPPRPPSGPRFNAEGGRRPRIEACAAGPDRYVGGGGEPPAPAPPVLRPSAPNTVLQLARWAPGPPGSGSPRWPGGVWVGPPRPKPGEGGGGGGSTSWPPRGLLSPASEGAATNNRPFGSGLVGSRGLTARTRPGERRGETEPSLVGARGAFRFPSAGPKALNRRRESGLCETVCVF